MTWVTQFIDGFDHMASAGLGAKWSFAASQATIDTGTFRNSGASVKIGTGSSAYATKSFAQARNICVGFAFLYGGPPAALGDSGAPVMALGNNQNDPFGAQVALAVLSDGKMYAVRCEVGTHTLTGPTTLGSSAAIFTASTWAYVELRVFVDDTAGELELRVNGVVALNLTGIDTKHQTSINYASVLALCGGNNTNTNNKYFDDLYLRTSSSATAEAGGFLGDIKVKPYLPNGDGTYSALTPSTGTTHYTLVDEATPNTTDYVSSSTALQKDSYTFADVSETGSIKAVQLSAYCYKADAGFRGVDVFVKSGATEDYAASKPLSTTGKYAIKLWEQNPNTAADWSQAEVNAAEFGVRISADV